MSTEKCEKLVLGCYLVLFDQKIGRIVSSCYPDDGSIFNDSLKNKILNNELLLGGSKSWFPLLYTWRINPPTALAKGFSAMVNIEDDDDDDDENRRGLVNYSTTILIVDYGHERKYPEDKQGLYRGDQFTFNFGFIAREDITRKHHAFQTLESVRDVLMMAELKQKLISLKYNGIFMDGDEKIKKEKQKIVKDFIELEIMKPIVEAKHIQLEVIVPFKNIPTNILIQTSLQEAHGTKRVASLLEKKILGKYVYIPKGILLQREYYDRLEETTSVDEMGFFFDKILLEYMSKNQSIAERPDLGIPLGPLLNSSSAKYMLPLGTVSWLFDGGLSQNGDISLDLNEFQNFKFEKKDVSDFFAEIAEKFPFFQSKEEEMMNILKFFTGKQSILFIIGDIFFGDNNPFPNITAFNEFIRFCVNRSILILQP